MITHLTLDHLRAYAAGDLTPRRRARTASHLAGCSRCRELAAWCEAVQSAARNAAGIPVPEGAWERIASRLHAGEAVLLPASDDAFSTAPRPWHRRAWVRAAAVLLLFAGVASATVPGSPFRTWFAGSAPEAAPSGGEPTAPGGGERASALAVEEVPEAALLVPPVAGAVAITIERPDPSLRIRVRLSEGEEVEVQARGGAADARFRTAPGRLAIAEAGAGEVVLALPRTVGRVTLQVDGSSYLTAERGQLRVLLPVADTAGSEIVLSVRR
jgi:hypothetical protein